MGWRRRRAADLVRVCPPHPYDRALDRTPTGRGERGIAAMKIDEQIGFVQCGFEGPE